MKKIILAMTLLGFVATQAPTAKAHSFPVAAAVIGGVTVGAVVADVVTHPVYYAPAPVVYAPAPVAVAYAPAPVVYTQPGYVCAPVVTYGFGFGRPVYGGYYHGYHGRYWR
ncbi:MAG TPA: hypothetical protein VH413_06465 [Verrucomicrobiae bacterium]|jgi:hypothetical protein|nr:hypothetical protein [Verrucomicrobiae bacterium]